MSKLLFRLWQWLRAEIFLGFLIATVFWAAVLGWQAAYAPTEAEKQKCQEAAEHEGRKSDECKNFWERTTTDPVAFFTLWLMIFTGGLTASTILLWRAGERQLILLRRSGAVQSRDMQASIKAATDAVGNGITANQISITNAQHQLRAYVAVRDISLVPRRKRETISAYGAVVDGPAHTYELAAILRNGGQTPAVNTRINVSCSELHIPLSDDFNFPDSDTFGHGLIGPDSEIVSPSIWVAAQNLETETAGRTWFFWGWVEYDDIFPDSLRHRTEFCFRINRRRLEWTNELVMSFAPDARFNKMDQGCTREFDPQANKYG